MDDELSGRIMMEKQIDIILIWMAQIFVIFDRKHFAAGGSEHHLRHRKMRKNSIVGINSIDYCLLPNVAFHQKR